MKTIRKTWKKATYFKGELELADTNCRSPIGFPTVFVAYGAAIRSGNWQSGTAINTPEYVIENYFDSIGNNKHDPMFMLWNYCKQLAHITRHDINGDVIDLIKLANNELNKLNILS